MSFIFAENVEGALLKWIWEVDISAPGHHACLLLYKQYLLVITYSSLFSKIHQLSLSYYFILHFGDKTVAYILFSAFTSRPNSLLATRTSVFICFFFVFFFAALFEAEVYILFSIVNVRKAIVCIRTDRLLLKIKILSRRWNPSWNFTTIVVPANWDHAL